MDCEKSCCVFKGIQLYWTRFGYNGLQWFLPKPSHGGFGNFFPTGTYAGIGTTCVEFENVMKSAMNKKKLPQTITVLFRFTHFRRNKLLCDKAPAVLSEFLGHGFAVKCFLHIQSWYILLLVGNCQFYPIKALWFYLTNKFQTLGIETLF